MDLCDPVVLPNGATVDSLQHWMLPTKVQVRLGGEDTAVWFVSGDSVLACPLFSPLKKRCVDAFSRSQC